MITLYWPRWKQHIIEKFAIQGEESTSLKEILNRAPGFLLDVILEKWEEEKDEAVSREHKEWIYTVRKRSNRGCTDEEMEKPKESVNITMAPEMPQKAAKGAKDPKENRKK